MKPKQKKYFVERDGHNQPFKVYRKAPSSEFKHTLVCSCSYKEHAELIMFALNNYPKA